MSIKPTETRNNMKTTILIILAAVLIVLTSCSAIVEQIKIEKAIYDWRDGRKDFLQEYRKEIEEVPEIGTLP